MLVLLLRIVLSQETCDCRTVPANYTFSGCQIFNSRAYCSEGFRDAGSIDKYFQAKWKNTVNTPESYDKRVACGIIRDSTMCKSLSYNFDCAIAAREYVCFICTNHNSLLMSPCNLSTQTQLPICYSSCASWANCLLHITSTEEYCQRYVKLNHVAEKGSNNCISLEVDWYSDVTMSSAPRRSTSLLCWFIIIFFFMSL
jgi:hypothetical protein